MQRLAARAQVQAVLEQAHQVSRLPTCTSDAHACAPSARNSSFSALSVVLCRQKPFSPSTGVAVADGSTESTGAGTASGDTDGSPASGAAASPSHAPAGSPYRLFNPQPHRKHHAHQPGRGVKDATASSAGADHDDHHVDVEHARLDLERMESADAEEVEEDDDDDDEEDGECEPCDAADEAAAADLAASAILPAAQPAVDRPVQLPPHLTATTPLVATPTPAHEARSSAASAPTIPAAAPQAASAPQTAWPASISVAQRGGPSSRPRPPAPSIGLWRTDTVMTDYGDQQTYQPQLMHQHLPTVEEHDASTSASSEAHAAAVRPPGAVAHVSAAGPADADSTSGDCRVMSPVPAIEPPFPAAPAPARPSAPAEPTRSTPPVGAATIAPVPLVGAPAVVFGASTAASAALPLAALPPALAGAAFVPVLVPDPLYPGVFRYALLPYAPPHAGGQMGGAADSAAVPHISALPLPAHVAVLSSVPAAAHAASSVGPNSVHLSATRPLPAAHAASEVAPSELAASAPHQQLPLRHPGPSTAAAATHHPHGTAAVPPVPASSLQLSSLSTASSPSAAGGSTSGGPTGDDWEVGSTSTASFVLDHGNGRGASDGRATGGVHIRSHEARLADEEAAAASPVVQLARSAAAHRCTDIDGAYREAQGEEGRESMRYRLHPPPQHVHPAAGTTHAVPSHHPLASPAAAHAGRGDRSGGTRAGAS